MNTFFAVRKAALGGVALWAVAMAMPAAAEPASPVPSVPTQAAPVVDATALFGVPSVSDKTLSTQRGGAAVSTSVDIAGTVKDTSATNVVTGANGIGGGSFAGSVGLPTVIQNSGANVLIQSSTTVNVQFR
ncbi:MAG: hypothetical protein JWP52_1669 [Rhizobacter sp.]|nr:hypothetical protein [Rhizobacter sp.]